MSPGDEQFIKSIDRAIKAMEGPATAFERSVHQQTNTIVVKVMNKDTGELIREIPPEKILDMVARFMEMNGMVVDEKV
ncbi:flagellar protein FlaG [compost metagenome]